MAEKEKTSGGIESNWTSLALACSQAVRPRIFVPHTYVSVAFGDPTVGGCNGSEGPAGGGRGMPHKAPSSAPPRHVVHAGRIKSTWRESRASPGIADRSRRDGRDPFPGEDWVCMCAYIHAPPLIV